MVLKHTLGTTFAIAFAAGAVGYWYASYRKAAASPTTPKDDNLEVPIMALPEAPYPQQAPYRQSPPFARVLPPGSTDAKLMNQLLTQAAAAPQTVDRALMGQLANWLAADGFQVDAQRVRDAIAHLPPLPTPNPAPIAQT